MIKKKIGFSEIILNFLMLLDFLILCLVQRNPRRYYFFIDIYLYTQMVWTEIPDLSSLEFCMVSKGKESTRE